MEIFINYASLNRVRFHVLLKLSAVACIVAYAEFDKAFL